MIIKKRLFYNIILLPSLLFLSMQANAACLPAGPFNGAANIIICDPGANESFDTLGGNDSVTVNSGIVNNIDMSTGRDTFILNNGTVNTVDQGSFGDIFTLNNGTLTSIDQGTGNDTATVVTGTMGTLLQSGGNDDVTINGGVITLINQGTGSDTATMTAGTLTDLIQHSGSDTFTMSGGTVTLIDQGSSSDILTFTGGNVLNLIDQGSFGDTLTISGGTINAIDQGSGADSLTISGASITGAIDQATGIDDFIMGAGAVVASLDQGNDLDTATINGGHIVGLFDNGDTVAFHAGRIGDVDLKKADNIFIMDGSLGAVSIDLDITAQEGSDTYTLTSGTIGGNVNSGSGNDIVTIGGTAIGGNLTTQNGDDIISISSGSVAGAIIAGDEVADGLNDDDSFNWSGGSILSFTGGKGSDTALVSAASYDGTQNLNGGDDVSIADGFIDTLTLNGITASVNAGNMVNWENVVVDGGGLNFVAGLFTVGSDAGTGLTLQNGAILNTAGGFTLNGNMTNNAGVIASQNGVVGDVTTITGNYASNNGQVHIDTVLAGDASVTDILVITGDTSGNGTVTVTNAGGLGAQTTNGIEIIQVGGLSNGNFLLNGDFVTDGGDQAVIGGAFGYTLNKQADGDWALLSELISSPSENNQLFSPAAPIYEAITQNMLILTELQTLQQRAGNRNWSAATEEGEIGFPDHDGGWIRVIAGNRHLDNTKSTTLMNSKTQYQKVLFGLDIPIRVTDKNQFIVGINGSYAHAKTDVHSFFGKGDIDSDGYSIGATATSYASSGVYIDGQFKYTIIDTDLHSNRLANLGNVDGKGISTSIEAGKRIAINPKRNLSITPQAQLSYTNINFDSFTGNYGERVSLDDDSSLTARIGITLNQQLKGEEINTKDDDNRRHLYAIANIIHEFDQKTSVIVTGAELRNKIDKTFLEVGLGGSYNWDSDRYSIFGEITGGTSLDNFRNSNSLAGTLGFRMKF